MRQYDGFLSCLLTADLEKQDRLHETVAALKEQCKRRGLKVSGNKRELRQRLLEGEVGAPAPNAAGSVGVPVPPPRVTLKRTRQVVSSESGLESDLESHSSGSEVDSSEVSSSDSITDNDGERWYLWIVMWRVLNDSSCGVAACFSLRDGFRRGACRERTRACLVLGEIQGPASNQRDF